MEVSRVGMGTWNIGNQWGEVSESTALATIRAAVDSGINLFDTAESYGIPNGLSEKRLGKALVGIRDRVHLVTKIGRWGKRTGQKVPMTTIDMVRLCTFASLYRLKTDWVDIMLCHEGKKLEDPSVYLEGFELLKEQGYLRAYGISTNRLDILKRFNVNNTCRVVEVEYSLLNPSPESEFLPYCQEHDIAVLVRGPLDKGLLSGKYTPGTVFTDSVRAEWYANEKKKAKLERKLARVEKLKSVVQPGEAMVTAAIRYVTSHPVQPVAIPEAKSPAQVQTNAKAGHCCINSMSWLQ